MNVKAHFYKQKVLKYCQTYSQSCKDTVYISVINGKVNINCEISDITPEETSVFERLLSNSCSSKELISYYCEANITSIVGISNTPFITNDIDVLKALFDLGFRSQDMLDLEKEDATEITDADYSFKKEISNKLETQLKESDESENVKSPIRQYCRKFGKVNFFGWAELVFIREFLLNQKNNLWQNNISLLKYKRPRINEAFLLIKILYRYTPLLLEKIILIFHYFLLTFLFIFIAL